MLAVTVSEGTGGVRERKEEGGKQVGEMGGSVALAAPPAEWLESFLNASFYSPCAAHEDSKKWCNLYCTSCLTPICADCRDAETSRCRRQNHVILQVVRSSYQAAVQIDGVAGIGQLLFDGEDDVQVYRANRVRILYLHSRSSGKVDSGKVSAYHCEVCEWPLLDQDKRYCSIGCKILPEQQLKRRRPQQEDGAAGTLLPEESTDDVAEAPRRRDKRKSKFPRRSPLM